MKREREKKRVDSAANYLFVLVKEYLVFCFIGISIALVYAIPRPFNPIVFYVFIALLIVLVFMKIRANLQTYRRWVYFLTDAQFRGLPFFDRRFFPNYDFVNEQPEPPLLAHYLFYFLLPSDIRDIVMADLLVIYAPIYRRSVAKYETRIPADLWYWGEVLTSLFPLLAWRIRSMFEDPTVPIALKEDVRDVIPFYRRHA